MRIHRKWEQGAADLVTVAVGMVVLSIVVVGTSAALVFGREALLHQEHYKQAAYMLRGKMEEQIWTLQAVAASREPGYLGPVNYRPERLDEAGDRTGRDNPVMCAISRDKVDEEDIPETREVPDYYILTMRARWSERADQQGNTQEREIVFKTAVPNPATF